MVWKIIAIENPGSANVIGGNDINKINKYLSGLDLQLDDDTDDVEIGTNTTVYNEKFSMLSPTTGFRYIWRTQDITADRYISLPLMDADGEISLSATTSANDWGTNMQTFRHQNIAFRNPANTFHYLLNTSAITANRSITLPLLGSDDTFVFANATQTLTNKTLTSPTITSMTVNTDSNTIKHSTTNNSGDLVANTGSKYDRFARGLANQVLCMNASGTGLLWVDSATLVSGGAVTDEEVKVFEGGVQVGSSARKLNFDGATFNVTEDTINDRFTITGVSSGGNSTTVYKNTSTVSVVNTSAETNLLSQTISGGSMGTNGMLHIVVSGWYLNDSGGSDSFHMRLYFGGNAIWEDESPTFSDATIRKPFHGEFWIKNMNSASVQMATGWYMFGNSNDSTIGFSDFSNVTTQPHGVINSTPSIINTSSSQTLAITIDHADADPDTSFNAEILLVELIN